MYNMPRCLCACLALFLLPGLLAADVALPPVHEWSVGKLDGSSLEFGGNMQQDLEALTFRVGLGLSAAGLAGLLALAVAAPLGRRRA